MVHCGHLAHYWHKNIAGPKVSVWKDGYRGFEDEVEMSHHIVKVFNQTMKEEDILYHLGDWSFGGIQNIWNFRKQLRIKTIHLILGNHDQHIKGNKILPEIIIPARSIFTSVQNALDIVIDKREIFMNHYPYVTWPHKDKDAIMLCGHIHGKMNKENIGSGRLDVGIDSAKLILGEYRPFSLEEVIKLTH